MRVFLDTETYSEVDIKNGGYAYAYHSSTRCLMLAIASGDRPVTLYTDKDLENPALRDMIREVLNRPYVEIWAHNANFDRHILEATLGIDTPVESWRDTMVLARALNYPSSLEKLGAYLGLPQDKAKDKEGKKLIRMFSLPQPVGLYKDIREAEPEAWNRFKSYCKQDVDAMRHCLRIMEQHTGGDIDAFNPTLWQEWHLDQRINDRGFAVDLSLCGAALDAIEEISKHIDERVSFLTDGRVSSVNQTKALIKELNDYYDLDISSLAKNVVEEVLTTDLTPTPRELLELRQIGSKSSTSKYAVLDKAHVDGRVSGCLQFMGASTGRWAGRLFQPQNLPRGTMSKDEVEKAIKSIKAGTVLEDYKDTTSSVLSNAIRGCLIAPEDRQLVVADLSNIEGRVLAWLAGETWKVDAFRAFDAGQGVDLYKATYARTFGVDAQSVTKAQRQIGKVLELAMGYQGGVGAFLTFARAYGLDLHDLVGQTRDAVSGAAWDAGLSAYERAVARGTTHDLERDVYCACDVIKTAWREAHPAIVRYWYTVEDLFKTASLKGKRLRVQGGGRLTLEDCTPVPYTNFVDVVLPSGRPMRYNGVRVGRDGICYLNPRYDMESISTYGGKLVENFCQAVARDVLMSSMPAIEASGFEIIMSIHDELLTEASQEHTAQELSDLMRTPAPWCLDLPLNAAGFTAQRYRKD